MNELAVLDFIQEHLTGGVGDVLMPAISFLGNGGMIWIILAVVLLLIPKKRKVGLAVVIGLLAMLLLCNIILKQVVGRTRPFEVNTAVKLLVKPPSDYSFPSGHTCAAVTAAAALFFRKSRLWLPVAVAAAVMGFSRLYLYVHYPTDVLGGALLGILCGWIGSILCGQIMKEKSSAGVEQKNRI